MAIETEIVANTPTTVITAPASTTYAIIGMFFTNHDSAVDETIDINVVKSGESVGNSNVIAKSVALTATNTLTYTEKFLIDDVVTYSSLIKYIIKKNNYDDYKIYENITKKSLLGNFLASYKNYNDAKFNICNRFEMSINVITPLFLKEC